MPKGVYDRSKTKEQRAAEKVEAKSSKASEQKPKRKYNKKSDYWASKAKVAAKPTASAPETKEPKKVIHETQDEFLTKLERLAALRNAFCHTEGNKSIMSRFDTLIGRELDKVETNNKPGQSLKDPGPKTEKPVQTAAPAPVVAAAPVMSAAPAPLPFTPAAVEQVAQKVNGTLS